MSNLLDDDSLEALKIDLKNWSFQADSKAKEKQQIRDPVLENSFIQTLFTQKNLQDLQCYYLN